MLGFLLTLCCLWHGASATGIEKTRQVVVGSDGGLLRREGAHARSAEVATATQEENTRHRLQHGLQPDTDTDADDAKEEMAEFDNDDNEEEDGESAALDEAATQAPTNFTDPELDDEAEDAEEDDEEGDEDEGGEAAAEGADQVGGKGTESAALIEGATQGYRRRRRRRHYRRRRRRGIALQKCNIITGGGVTMICPPGFKYSAKGVCKGHKHGPTCTDWGTGGCDPRKYVMPNGLHWPNSKWMIPKAGNPTVTGATVVYTSGWWYTHGAPTYYCITPGGAPPLLEISSCSASTNQAWYHCKKAMDGVLTSRYGWAYSAVKKSWVAFHLAGAFDISRVDVISGVGRTNHHLTDFRLKTKSGIRWMGVYALNFVNMVPKGSKTVYDRAILAGKPQRVDLSFHVRKKVSAVRIHVLKTDASNGNAVLTEVLVYHHTGCNDLAMVAGNQRVSKLFWKAKCLKVPKNTYMMEVQMGLRTDAFKPLPGVSFCNMLSSAVKHRWSADGGFTWKTPDFYSSHFGGSGAWWPKKHVQADHRAYLSFWGTTRRRDLRGGCCDDGTNKKAAWQRTFTMRFCSLPVGANKPCKHGMVHKMGAGGMKLGCTACKAGYYDPGHYHDTCSRCHGSSRRRRATMCTKSLVTYKRVGSGECLDAVGMKYSSFLHAGCHTQDLCQDACENFDADQCRGFTFHTDKLDCGKCELRMEAKFTTGSSGWLLKKVHKGVGVIKKSLTYAADKRVCYARVMPTKLNAKALHKPIPGWTCPAAITVKGFLHHTKYNGVYTLHKDLKHGVPSYRKGKIIIASNHIHTAWKIGLEGKELAMCDADNFPMALNDRSCFTDEGRCAFSEHNGQEYVGVSVISKSAQAACDSDGIFLLPVPHAKCPANLELPRCDAVLAGQMCEGDGECGTDDSLDNCERFDIYYKQAPTDTTTTTPGPQFVSAGWGVPECPTHYLRVMDFASCLEGGLQAHPEAKDGILPPFAVGMWPSEPRGCYVKVYPDGIRRLVHLNHPPAGGLIHPFQTLICMYKDSHPITPPSITPCPGSINDPPPV